MLFFQGFALPPPRENLLRALVHTALDLAPTCFSRARELPE